MRRTTPGSSATASATHVARTDRPNFVVVYALTRAVLLTRAAQVLDEPPDMEEMPEPTPLEEPPAEEAEAEVRPRGSEARGSVTVLLVFGRPL